LSQIVIRYTELPWNDRNRIVLFFLSNSLFTIPFFLQNLDWSRFFLSKFEDGKDHYDDSKSCGLCIYIFLFLNHFFILVVSSPLVSSILARLASAIAINRCNICRNFITFCQSGCAANFCGAFLNRSPNLLCSANSHACNFRMAKFSSSSLVSGCCWSCCSDLSWYSCSDLSGLVWSLDWWDKDAPPEFLGCLLFIIDRRWCCRNQLEKNMAFWPIWAKIGFGWGAVLVLVLQILALGCVQIVGQNLDVTQKGVKCL